MIEFVGICYYNDKVNDISQELVAVVVANTKSEALGLLLEKYPNTLASYWNIYGGETEAKDLSISEEINYTTSYWG